jgi:hypothetical protein
MTERDIVICGHGSNTPSYKNMYDYLALRWSQFASNGKHKGIVAVRRLKGLTDDNRQLFQQYYSTIIGRNIYSQNLREYCYTMYKGAFYSDCSSSGILTFKKIGFKFPWTLNTAAIYESDLFESVAVKIKDGHITNPEMLKVGDCLLFAGNDPSRPLQIGHVEYVYNMPKVTSTTPTVSQPETFPKWVKSGDNWYYRLADGVNAYGWKNIKAKDGNTYRYHFADDGKMLTGWQLIKGAWYFFHDTPGSGREGAMYVSDQDGKQHIATFD